MNRYYLIVLFVLSLSGIKSFAQCVDATFIPTFFNPNPGVEVNFLYWGEMIFDASWDYEIDYGNGTSDIGSGPLVSAHLGEVTYSTPGIYTVTLTVTDAFSCALSYSLAVDVENPSGDCPIYTLHLDDFKNFVCTNDTIQFNLNIHTPLTVDYVVWDLGDGNIVTTATDFIDYQYQEPGIYFVQAWVGITSNLCTRSAISNVPIGAGYEMGDYIQVYVFDGDPEFIMSPSVPNAGDNVTFTYTGDPTMFPPDFTNYWSLEFYYDAVLENNTGPLVNGMNLYTENPISAGSHSALLEVFIDTPTDKICESEYQINFVVEEEPCDTCNSFKPVPGKSYWISAWVQEEPDTPGEQVTGYDDVSVTLDYVSTSGTTTSPPLYPTGEIIDGWQRIAGEFTIPSGTLDLQVNFNAGANVTYFDDIRIHPFNGSMKSYVYDGETFWLVAELDDNNYATIYEYDAEGGLVRIKKETSGGIVTIQETRSNTVKIEP